MKDKISKKIGCIYLAFAHMPKVTNAEHNVFIVYWIVVSWFPLKKYFTWLNKSNIKKQNKNKSSILIPTLIRPMPIISSLNIKK